MQEITCESLEQQYQVLQDIADEYKAILMSEGSGSEKAKELRTSFATETERLRENIVLYKERQEGTFYLSAEYRSGAAYIAALEEKRGRLFSSAKDLLNQLTTIPEEQVRLKKVTMKDLGLPLSVPVVKSVEEILKAAKAQGLKPCPPWVGPQYCLAAGAGKESVVIGMEPLTDSSGHARVFTSFKSKRRARGNITMRTSDLLLYSPFRDWLFVSDK
ncbi:MAG: hypothetical protein OXB96_00900 [Candidatus Kaiserbacteria bacterium]|nr:hypothetical protein [Candidatus Kaiserbacteria bacterium]